MKKHLKERTHHNFYSACEDLKDNAEDFWPVGLFFALPVGIVSAIVKWHPEAGFFTGIFIYVGLLIAIRLILYIIALLGDVFENADKKDKIREFNVSLPERNKEIDSGNEKTAIEYHSKFERWHKNRLENIAKTVPPLKNEKTLAQKRNRSNCRLLFLLK